jgi:hypothetical protein
MPKMKTKVRIIQNDTNGRQKLSFPIDIGWHVGDVIQYEKMDEVSVVLKRLHN